MKFLEENHIVQGWLFVDANGGVNSDIVSLAHYDHVAILLQLGNTTAGGDCDIVVQACDDVSASHTAAVNNYTLRRSPATTSSDVFAADVSITDSKIDYVAGGEIVPDTDDNCLFVIDVDAALVKAASTTYDMDCLRLVVPNPGQGMPCSCTFILSKPRHMSAATTSAIV
jgi:hypothetical protein